MEQLSLTNFNNKVVGIKTITIYASFNLDQ